MKEKKRKKKKHEFLYLFIYLFYFIFQGIVRVDPVVYTTFVNWKLNDTKLQISDPNPDLREGVAKEFEVLGTVPDPVALIVAMYK